MPESNFIDYVKILCRSGKAVQARAIFIVRNMCPKGGRTEETAVVAAI